LQLKAGERLFIFGDVAQQKSDTITRAVGAWATVPEVPWLEL
jgi:hypothetical protein